MLNSTCSHPCMAQCWLRIYSSGTLRVMLQPASHARFTWSQASCSQSWPHSFHVQTQRAQLPGTLHSGLLSDEVFRAFACTE